MATNTPSNQEHTRHDSPTDSHRYPRPVAGMALPGLLMSNITKDFNGLPIVFRDDGYMKITEPCKAYKKRPAKFLELPGTDEYLDALSEFLNIQKSDLWITKKGRYGYTLLHPKPPVFFARWLDVRFAVWCDLMIDNILRDNIQTTVATHTKEAEATHEAGERMKAHILELEGITAPEQAADTP